MGFATEIFRAVETVDCRSTGAEDRDDTEGEPSDFTVKANTLVVATIARRSRKRGMVLVIVTWVVLYVVVASDDFNFFNLTVAATVACTGCLWIDHF